MSRSRLRLSVGRLSRLAPGVASSVFVPSVELPAFAFPSSSGCHRSNFQLAPVVPPLALPKARRPACAFRLYPPVRPVSLRLPTRVGCLAPASCGWLSRLSSGAPSSGVVPFDRLPAQSFTNPLILLPVSFQLAPSSGSSATSAIHFRLTARSSVGQTLRISRLCMQVQIMSFVWIAMAPFRPPKGAVDKYRKSRGGGQIRAGNHCLITRAGQ